MQLEIALIANVETNESDCLIVLTPLVPTWTKLCRHNQVKHFLSTSTA